MGKHLKHNSGTCPGSICVGDDTPGWQKNVIWYPGEPVCVKKPFSHVQKIQNRINKLVKKGIFKFTKRYWTFEMLNKKYAVMTASKGGNPVKDHEPSRNAPRDKKQPRKTVTGKVTALKARKGT